MSEEKRQYRIEGRPATIYRVIKSPDNPYVMIDRRPIDNAALSFKAKGILTYLLSRPDGWEVSVADLIKRSTDGEAAVRSGLLELKKAGHMKYTKTRQGGRITGWLIEVYEVPHSDFQDVVFQDVENQGQVLKNLSNNKNNIPANAVSKIIQEADKEVDAMLGFEKLAQQAETAGIAWRGREYFVGTEYLKYADWWHKKTGLHMYGSKGKAKFDKAWQKAFKELWENDVKIESLDIAWESTKWKHPLSNPMQIVNDAKAVQAAPQVNNNSNDRTTLLRTL